MSPSSILRFDCHSKCQVSLLFPCIQSYYLPTLLLHDILSVTDSHNSFSFFLSLFLSPPSLSLNRWIDIVLIS